MTVTSFGIRPNPFVRGQTGLGAEPSTLAALRLGFQLDTGTVDSPCPTPSTVDQWQGGSELGIEVTKTENGLAVAKGLLIRYIDASGRRRSLEVPFGIALCAATLSCDETPGLGL